MFARSRGECFRGRRSAGRFAIFCAAPCIAAVLATLVAAPRQAHAGKAEFLGAKGMGLARKGDCVKATPLLEEAELLRHRPVVASALAGCYVSLGELIKAAELYHAIEDEQPQRGWTAGDRKAVKDAKKKAEEVDARIPTLTLSIADSYDDLDVTINGKSWSDPLEPKQVAPDTAVVIEANAKGAEPFKRRLVLSEGERRVLELKLVVAPKTPPRQTPSPAEAQSSTWLGARFRGFMMPKFVVNTVFDGGQTLFAPGGGVTLETHVGDTILIFSAAYASYSAPEMPIKKVGTPDTEYEIVESDLNALFATLDIMWQKQFDDEGHWSGRIGVGVGVGWLFLGNLYRTQAYPTKESGNDPYLYAKCKGPNNPPGSFRYCNQLDADATHYNGYTEPSWFDGGKLPTVFPFLAIPELGLAWTPSPRVGVDLTVATSISGLMVDLGFRYGL
jgi:hypothetical protein